jgi:hypothetical protein
VRKAFGFILAIVLWSACAAPAVAADEVSAAKRQKIDEFMAILCVKNISRQASMSIAKQLAFGLKQAQPDIDPKAFDVVLTISDEVLSAHSDDLLEKMVPLYDKHFTEAEIDELLKFYKSPVGRKTTETMPALMQESMELAIKEAQTSVPTIQEKVKEKLRADGLVKDK